MFEMGNVYHDCWFPCVDKQGVPRLQHGVIQTAAFSVIVDLANGRDVGRAPRQIEVVVRDDYYGFDSLRVNRDRILILPPSAATEEKILARFVAETFADKIKEADWEVQNLKAKARRMELELEKVLKQKGGAE